MRVKTHFIAFEQGVSDLQRHFEKTDIPSFIIAAIILCEERAFFPRPPQTLFDITVSYITSSENGRINRDITRLYLSERINYVPFLTMITEILFSFFLERFEDKKQLFLFFWVNSRFRCGARGFEQASLKFFGKSLVWLKLNEILVLISDLEIPTYSKWTIYGLFSDLYFKHYFRYTNHYRLILRWKNEFLSDLKQREIIDERMYRVFACNNCEVLSYHIFTRDKSSSELTMHEFEEEFVKVKQELEESIS